MADQIKRSDFIRHLHLEAGIPYLMAERACTVFMRLMENSIAGKKSIHLGRVGVLKPVAVKSKRVMMHFRRKGGVGGGDMEAIRQEFYIGARTRFVFKLNRRFRIDHGLAP